MESLSTYVFPVLLAGFFLVRFLRFRQVKALLSALRKEGAIVVDVRSTSEFQGAASPGSVNIPLNELAARATELDASCPVFLCCASGTRSGLAATVLKSKGFKRVYNAGPWHNTIH